MECEHYIRETPSSNAFYICFEYNVFSCQTSIKNGCWIFSWLINVIFSNINVVIQILDLFFIPISLTYKFVLESSIKTLNHYLVFKLYLVDLNQVTAVFHTMYRFQS